MSTPPGHPVSYGLRAPEIERLDIAQLARLVRERRGEQSLRQAAAEAGVSFSTMSRVEAGAQPDLTSFTRLCAWLALPPSRFFNRIVERHVPPIENAIAQLNSDPRLSPQAAALMADMLKQMYENLASTNQPPQSLVACHLRAATVLRPGVARRLGSVLQDLHSALAEAVEAGEL